VARLFPLKDERAAHAFISRLLKKSPAVIARSNATKQSRSLVWRWIASPSARNDGGAGSTSSHHSPDSILQIPDRRLRGVRNDDGTFFNILDARIKSAHDNP